MSDAYLLDNAWELARARFAGLELASDPDTFRGLDGIGVAPGWRCLEAGAGSGSVARWLARRVGPSGRVTAVDLDTRHLVAAAQPHEREALDVREGDIRTLALTPASYDLVHTRAFLVHLPQREALLARFMEVLKPGGVALLEEPDWRYADVPPGVAAQPAELYRRVLGAVHDVLVERGMQTHFGLELPDMARRAGFRVESTRGYTQVVQGGSEATRFEWLTFLQLRELTCERAHIDRPEFDAFLELFHDPTFSYVRPLICCVTARRP